MPLQYNVVIEDTKISGISHKTMNGLLSSIDNEKSLDGNGAIYLVLQDITLPSFVKKSDELMGSAPAGVPVKDWQPER